VKFRPDVDGLRGVAVLLVVAYHAKLGLVPAGYVGVDVFLVISGFLITGILIDLMDHGRFSAATFLARRMRRLMPAAIVMIAATLLAGWFILGPRDLRRLAGSSIAVFALAGNFFFWGRQGYFADQVPEQALLHTWSLGLEEQFYLAFPPALLAIAAVVPRLRVAAFTSAAVVLFGFGVWLTGSHPGAAFYLLPARAWEFLVGGLVALLASRAAPSTWLRATVGIGGLAAILVSAIGLTPATPYPGVAALVPVVAAGGVIWANCQGQTLGGRLLSTRWLVAIGVTSYSLYLWHWPVLTLARYYVGRDLDAIETLCALCGVALLTYASWRWVERPFRLAADPNAPRRPLTAVVVLGVIVLVATIVTVQRDGFPSRLSAAALAFDSAGLPDSPDTNLCHRGPPAAGTLCTLAPPVRTHAHLLVWGDSHANAIAPALTELGKMHAVGVTQASYSSCPPLLDVRVAHVPDSHYCREFNSSVLRAVKDLGITRVLLAADWTAYLPSRPEPALARFLDPYRRSDYLAGGDAAQNERNLSAALERTVRALERLGVEIWIMRQVPTQDVLVPLALSRAATRGRDYADMGITLAGYRRSQAHTDALFDALGNSVHMIDPAIRLCASGVCMCSAGGQALYIDANHLSQSGAKLIAPVLEVSFH
jgi:peptidoglycan/LPS O-acetylase OafA/YrhL